MDEVGISQIKGKIISGVFALSTRTLILQIIAFTATFFLTILLSPSVFGVFFVVSAVISFLSYFSDIGLAAALIQKKDELTRDELVTAFTIQQILVGIIVISILFISPAIAKFYSLENGGLFLMHAMVISFFISSLKTIPSILLERKLEFKSLIIPQILETGTFYIVAIILALLGRGVESFAWAAILRGIIGLVAIYIISPWRISFGISKTAAVHLLSFGTPFQANSILALIKDDLITIFLGKILPLNQVGYIGWAKKWAEVFLRLIMDSVIRVTFPAFSRLQKNKKILSVAIEKTLFFLALFIFPTTTIFVLYIKPLIAVIPRYIKWEPALFSFYLFSFSSVWAAFSSPLVNALNAVGKIKVTLVLMLIWTLLTWILVPLFTRQFGFNGVAIASFIISFTGFMPFILMKKVISFRIIRPISKPVVATIIVAIPIYLILHIQQTIAAIFISCVLGVLIYCAITWFWMKDEIAPYLPARLVGPPKIKQ